MLCVFELNCSNSSVTDSYGHDYSLMKYVLKEVTPIY